MTHSKQTLLPRYSPITWLYLAGLVYLSCALISVFLITHQPYLGISLMASEDGKSVTISATHTPTTQNKLFVGDTIISIASNNDNSLSIGSLSIMEEPDNFKTYHEYNQFIEHQQDLYEILSQAIVSVTLSNGRNIQLKPARVRPINHLPFQFWVLLITAGIGFFIGLWIWIFRRGQIEARLLAISGFGFMLGACCLAVYSNRELVIEPLQFKLLADFNHLGNISFAYTSLILLCYYPSKIANIPFAFIGFIALLFVWLNESLQWFEIPVHTFYFLPYIASSALGFFIGRWQWIKHKKNPVAKAAIRWFLLTLTLCIGCALVLYFIPTFFNEPPLLPVWIAQFLILALYIGLVLGVIQYRLFDVEQWWFNCWIWFFSGCSVIAIDLSLMYLFNISPLESLSVAILVIAWCYFPFRQWLWTKKIHPRSSRVNDFFPLLTQSYISSPSISQFKNSWPEILSNIYLPLSVQLHLQAVDSVVLSNHGMTIILPALNDHQHLALSGKERGGKLFSKHDVDFIETALTHARNCITWKNNREAGAKQERERIMRDLHDDVGALLLTLIHKAESEENAQLAKSALKGVRDTIYSLHDENFSTFDSALCTWREEIIQRTDAAQVDLQWDIDKLHTDYFLSPRQRINLDRILRESFTNILKHAIPQTIIVSINIHKENMQIIITDDGIHSDSSQWQANTGLYSLHTRAKEIKATLDWTLANDPPEKNNGTKLTITLPNMEKASHAFNPDC